MADKIAGYVLPIVGIVLAVLPVKEWLKRLLPFLWPDYWENSSTVDSSTPSADSEDANRKTRRGIREDWYPYGPADVKELYKINGRFQYLENTLERLSEENERLRDRQNAISVQRVYLAATGRDGVAANSDHPPPPRPL